MTATPRLSMDDVFTLSARELERLVQIVHSSLEVRRRNQFFLWTQGLLQSLIPHEVLICAAGDHGRRNLSIEHFSSYPLPDQDIANLVDADGGLMIQAIRLWAERGDKPLLICNSDRASPVYRRFEATLYRHAFANLAVHGTPALQGHSATYFSFASLPQPLTPRQGYLIEILLPHIHCAFVRMLGNERQEPLQRPGSDSLVTAREIEILQWVREGKSNQEIGHILGISPLTVKNHVQKILKKLNVQNRAQAVARGISLSIIKMSAN
ncbi:MAG: XrtB/PEP-CTERM-associated transcriptional regulator EpsA [Betaproteobacteria bacterium]